MTREYIPFDARVAAAICAELSAGNSLRTICAGTGMPDRHTVARWRVEHEAFRRDYELARTWWADAIAEEVVDLADDVAGATDNAVVAAARVRIDARRWIAAKLLPGRFGDQLALTGAGGRDLIPASREQRLPQLVSILAVLMPDADNGELFSVAAKLLDKLGSGEGVALPAGGDLAA